MAWKVNKSFDLHSLITSILYKVFNFKKIQWFLNFFFFKFFYCLNKLLI
jgi:hypothetical protein